MSTRPILFNTEMVRAILDYRKTVTRRVVKTAHGGTLEVHDDIGGTARLCERCAEMCRGLNPPYNPGDVLWVRETFFRDECTPYCDGWDDPGCCPSTRVENYCYGYRTQYGDDTGEIKWHPSIHMPKAAARLFLRVKSVRVERLRDIECIATEGITMVSMNAKRDSRYYFAKLWNSTIKPTDLPRYGWDANPWVWVIEFERCERPEDFLKEGADHGN